MYQVKAEPKIRRRATAAPRGVVGRKPNPKIRDDEQESDIRCDVVGTSEHVIAKLSARTARRVSDWDRFEEVSRRHSSSLARAGSSRRRMIRPTKDPEASHGTKV
jgi:hypothetical protein